MVEAIYPSADLKPLTMQASTTYAIAWLIKNPGRTTDLLYAIDDRRASNEDLKVLCDLDLARELCPRHFLPTMNVMPLYARFVQTGEERSRQLAEMEEWNAQNPDTVEPYIQGRRARDAREKLSENPFTVDGWARDAWNRGWINRHWFLDTPLDSLMNNVLAIIR